ncbi:MAG: (d)CMP kinase [Alphaproteobacteria bacterium]
MVFRIAIDGPAASGKGTIARGIARALGYAYLESGLVYRATAWRLKKMDNKKQNESQNESNESMEDLAVKAARDVVMEDLQNPALRSEEIAALSSQIATLPKVRDTLRSLQREFASHPPNCAPGVVMDGRDIATVILPEAEVKIFIDADLQTRAKRRAHEEERNTADVLAELKARDQRDQTRDHAPLRHAKDAAHLDTSRLTIKEAIAAALEIVQSKNPP